MIYFISAGPDGPIKIGYASNPKKRLASLQTAHHQELTLLRVIPGNTTAEGILHRRFKKDRLKGEWFKPSEDVLGFINSEGAWGEFVAENEGNWRSEVPHPDAEHIIALGDTSHVAEQIGVSPTAVSNWKRRGVPWRMRPLIKDLARRKRLKLPADFLTSKKQKESEA